MTTTVLLVHGIGTHKPGNMKAAFTSAINETAQKHFGLAYDINTDSQVTIREFNYSEEFDQERQKMAKAAKGGHEQLVSQLTEFTNGLPSSLVKKLLKGLTKLDKDGFIYEYLLDILLYGSTHCGPRTRARMTDEINQLVNNKGKLVIVAHSMGTAVAHDSLNSLYTQHPKINTVKGLVTFANVSRMLPLISRLPDPSQSRVHLDTDNNGCIRDFFINGHNVLDPLTHFLPFHKTQSFNVQHLLQSIQKKVNPHGFGQYAAHPDFVAEFLNNVCYAPKRLYSEDVKKALHSYKQGSLNHKFEDVRTKLDDLTDDDINIRELIAFFKAVKEVYRELEQLAAQENS